MKKYKLLTSILSGLVIILLLIIGLLTFIIFKGNNNEDAMITNTGNSLGDIETSHECEEMNGWWGISGGLYDMTITAPEVKWGDYYGTIELCQNSHDISIPVKNAKYVLTFKFTKDGYTRTEKHFITEAEENSDYDYYIYYEGRPGLGSPMYKKSD